MSKVMAARRRRKKAFKISRRCVSNENEDTSVCIKCNIMWRESDRILQIDFCGNLYCYTCTRVSAKFYDALCKSTH